MADAVERLPGAPCGAVLAVARGAGDLGDGGLRRFGLAEESVRPVFSRDSSRPCEFLQVQLSHPDPHSPTFDRYKTRVMRVRAKRISSG